MELEKFFTVKELAQFLKCSASAIHKKTMHKQIPHYKVNRAIIFKYSEIMEWLKQSSVEQEEFAKD